MQRSQKLEFYRAGIYEPGALVELNLEKYLLIEGTGPAQIDLSRYMEKDQQLQLFGKKPVALVLCIDHLDTFYNVLLGTKRYWVPAWGVTRLKKN